MKKTLLMLFAAFCAAQTMFALTIEEGKYYTIKANSDKSTAFMADNNAADDRIEGVGIDTPSSYWQFEPTGNTDCYYIKNKKTGRYIQGYPASNERKVTMGDEPVEYCVKTFAGIDGRFYFAAASLQHDFASGTIGLNLHAESYEDGCYVQSYEAVATGNGRSQWTLSEVTKDIKVYTIANNTDLTQYVKDNGSDNIAVGSLDNASLWQFEETSSGWFYVKNVKTGRYAQACDAAGGKPVTMGETPVEYAVVEKAAGVYGLTSADHGNKAFNSDKCIGWNWHSENHIVQTFKAEYGNNNKSFWKFTELEPQSITAAGYATYCATEDVVVLGAQAYKGSIAGSYVSLTEVSDVPAGSAVVLKGSLYATVAKTASSDMSGNDLQASTGFTSDGTQYCLAEKTKVGFYRVQAGVTILAGKAYLTVPVSIKEFYGFDDDDATGIETVDNRQQTTDNSPIYNLAGQRIQKMQKGINIVNGKKILK